MRKIDHIVLDMESTTNNFLKTHWTKSLNTFIYFKFLKDIDFYEKILINTSLSNYKLFTKEDSSLNFKLQTDSNFLYNKFSYKKKKLTLKLINSTQPLNKHSSNVSFENNLSSTLFQYNNVLSLNTTRTKINKFFLNKSNLSYFFLKVGRYNTFSKVTNIPTTYSLININFLIKERVYTKLKYSRTPSFDIISGGFALLLAGFFGFLISEKFGYELGDSGDFYFVFMYLVLVALILRPLLIVSDFTKGYFNIFSVWRVVVFFKIILISFFNYFFNY